MKKNKNLSELNNKLGELLVFISEVAISARMNTAYNGNSIKNQETPRAAMWLVDMLHNFHGIGNALSESNTHKFLNELGMLKSTWEHNKENITHSLSVNEHGHYWSVDKGIELLSEIENIYSMND